MYVVSSIEKWYLQQGAVQMQESSKEKKEADDNDGRDSQEDEPRLFKY